MLYEVITLIKRDIVVDDRGDVPSFRWRADADNPRAMNTGAAAKIATDVANHVSSALSEGAAVLVLGGDCTVELGTVAGALAETENVGLVYIDGDTDLNTPESTQDGALDWMGVAHMLGVKDSVPELINVGPRTPLLAPDQILFFANFNSKPFERRLIEEHNIAEVKLEEVVIDPVSAAQTRITSYNVCYTKLLRSAHYGLCSTHRIDDDLFQLDLCNIVLFY